MKETNNMVRKKEKCMEVAFTKVKRPEERTVHNNGCKKGIYTSTKLKYNF